MPTLATARSHPSCIAALPSSRAAVSVDFLKRSNRRFDEWWQWWCDLDFEIPPLSLFPHQSSNQYRDEASGERPVLSRRLEVVTAPLDWANAIVTRHHYRKKPLHPKALPLAYGILIDGIPVGTFIVGTPHLRRMNGLFGKDTRIVLSQSTDLTQLALMRPLWLAEKLITVCERSPDSGYASWAEVFEINADLQLSEHPQWQRYQHLFKLSEADVLPTIWQVLMLGRAYLHPSVQHIQILDSAGNPRFNRKGSPMQLNVASCALSKLLRRIQKDWLLHHPPRSLDEPYHITRVITWADVEGEGHLGTSYRAAGFYEFKRTEKQKPTEKGNRGAKSGTEKICYVFNMSEPRWEAPLFQLSLPVV